jgi:peptidoglycan/xylan/chitin deacetylase (PgdA/CDA1 family)
MTSCKQASATEPFTFGDSSVDYGVSSNYVVNRNFGISENALQLPKLSKDHLRIPILMYHYIRPMPGPKDKLGQGLTVTPETFTKQLDALVQKGYSSITFADLVNSGAVLPAKPIILTFDDGYQDAYDQALPALLSHHLKAVFYIISSFPGKPNFATWNEIQEMSGSGMEIGAHTVDHHDLAKLSVSQQTHEIADSISMIEKKLSIDVLSVAYPSGRYNVPLQSRRIQVFLPEKIIV